MSKLFEVTIELTQRCPNECIYCSSLSSIDAAETLSYETVCHIVDDAVLLGAKQINLSGGEPFLREDITAIVDYVHAKGLSVRLYSSGIYYDENYQAIPEELLRSIVGKVDFLIFNYESSEPEYYADIMGTNKENLELIDKSILKSVALGINVEAHIVPMKCNFRQIPGTLKKLFSMGVSKVSLLRLVPQGRAEFYKEKVLLSDDEQEDLKSIALSMSEQYGDKLRLGKPFRTGTYKSCMTGTIRLAVRYDGLVFPCGAFKDGMMEFMNYQPDNVKEKRLVDIYQSSGYVIKVREELEKYYDSEVTEPCFGQWCRNQKDNNKA